MRSSSFRGLPPRRLFCSFRFDTEEQAKDAVDKFHGMEFDKKHTFKAYPLDEFQGIVNYDAPEPSRDSVEVTKTDVPGSEGF